jgi:Tfp pilus assembly ATPase PilU
MRALQEFIKTEECNFTMPPTALSLFRVNAFVQQGIPGIGLRIITFGIPILAVLNLSPIGISPYIKISLSRSYC